MQKFAQLREKLAENKEQSRTDMLRLFDHYKQKIRKDKFAGQLKAGFEKEYTEEPSPEKEA